MDQAAFTIVSPIPADKVQDIKDRLEKTGIATGQGSAFPFSTHKYDRLHYCCFLVLNDEDKTPLLVFEGNIDGPKDEFFAQLVQNDLTFLREVYGLCKDFPSDAGDVVQYLQDHDEGYNAFYVGKPGRTVTQIMQEETLRVGIEKHLDRNPELHQMSPEEVRSNIQDFARSYFPWAEQIPDKPWQVRFGKWLIGLALLGVVAILVGSTGYFGKMVQHVSWVVVGLVIFSLIYLKYRESRDKQAEVDWKQDHIKDIQANEDKMLQNHLTSITEIKAGLGRGIGLRVILSLINFAARFYFFSGNLGGITTIHFARWRIIDGGRRLLFFSNYDGSWENYLGEFIDQSSLGLTAVWCNTELDKDKGFPKTGFLFLSGGSRDEQRFKAYARSSQRKEHIWYSAYPHLSIKNIINNMHIREGLYGNIKDISGWLRRF